MCLRGRAGSPRCSQITAIVVFLALAPGAGAQTVFHATQPARPNDTVIVTGDSLGGTEYVEVARAADRPRLMPGARGTLDGWTRVEPLLVSDESVHFVVPESLPLGVCAYRLNTDDPDAPPHWLNAPNVWWMQGDRGMAAASPGGWLRIFGKSLGLDEAPRVALYRDGQCVQPPVQAVRDEPNEWALTVWLPEGMAEAQYRAFVQNGRGGADGWREAGPLTVSRAPVWPASVFSVADFADGAESDTKAIQAALDAAGENGGGTVLLPRGAYRVSETLTVPRSVTLRGEGQQLVSLTWDDSEEPLRALIRGTNSFAVMDLTIYAFNHLNGIVADRGKSEDSGNVTIARVRMRLDRLVLGRRYEDALAEAERRGRIEGRAAAIQVGGDNVQITDCDISITPLFKHGSVLGLILDRATGTVIARNRIAGPPRAMIMTKGGDGIIFEDNDVTAGGFLGTHHTPGDELGGGGSLLNPYFQSLYYARNVVHDNNWWDRELWALDSHGPAGAYEGGIESAEGRRVTLAADPRYAGENWRRWIGAGLYILDGKGAGQYRRITGGDERLVEVDRAWDVPPDETSRVSIAKFHGRLLVVRNTFRDGGNVMLWGGGIDCVLAENRFERIGSMLTTTSYIYNGLMPIWNVEFSGNEVIEGNGSFGGSTGIGHATYDSDRFYDVFDGFVSRAVLIRRNVVHNNGKLYVSGAVRDCVIEHNTVRDSGRGIEVSSRGDARPEMVLIRGNEMEGVAAEMVGDCLGVATVAPSPLAPLPGGEG